MAVVYGRPPSLGYPLSRNKPFVPGNCRFCASRQPASIPLSIKPGPRATSRTSSDLVGAMDCRRHRHDRLTHISHTEHGATAERYAELFIVNSLRRFLIDLSNLASNNADPGATSGRFCVRHVGYWRDEQRIRPSIPSTRRKITILNLPPHRSRQNLRAKFYGRRVHPDELQILQSRMKYVRNGQCKVLTQIRIHSVI